MGRFVVMFRIEEAKVEVDSKKNLWLQSPSGAGLVGEPGGAKMACAACSLVQDSQGGGSRQKRLVPGVCARNSPSILPASSAAQKYAPV